MSQEPYQVFGPGIPQLRGRAEDWKRLMRRLEKPVPDHVSVVGPRYIGKTVLLNAVADHFTENHANFDGCAYWNIGHDTPQTDAEFYLTFGKYAGKAISTFETVSNYLNVEAADFEKLSDAFEMLEGDDRKVLIIMDGLDHLRHNAQLSRNLWDSLRALAERSSLRFLMGSQKPLREICATPEARTSPFWNIFADSTIKLGAFDREEDWEHVLAPFGERGIELQPGARTELFNFSGGIPVLASALCKRLWDNVNDGTSVSNSDVITLAEDFVDRARSILDDLWDDCSAEEQGVTADLALGRSLQVGDVSRDCLLKLKQRGFVRDERSNLMICRTIVHYVTAYNPQATDLRRLFESKEEYQRNIKRVLELRAGQLLSVSGVDDLLVEYVRFAIQKLDKPALVVSEIRSLVNRAFRIIWDEELPDGIIPVEWTNGWKLPASDGSRPELNPPEGRIPGGGGAQCKLLNLMTDSRKAGRTRISRPTFFMIDYLQSVGDFGQHLDDSQIPVGFTHSVCLTAIELCEQLTGELSHGAQAASP